eukprot:103186_1
MNTRDYKVHLKDLLDVPHQKRIKEIKLLSKIFNNILSHPLEQKYRTLNAATIYKKFSQLQCRPCIYLLYNIGFKESLDGKRIEWKFTTENHNILKHLNNHIQNLLKSNITSTELIKNESDNENHLKRQHKDTENMRKLREIYEQCITTDRVPYVINSNHLLEYDNKTADTNPLQLFFRNEQRKESYDKAVVDQLVTLNIASREECIKASKKTVNYRDPNAVFETLEKMLKKQDYVFNKEITEINHTSKEQTDQKMKVHSDEKYDEKEKYDEQIVNKLVSLGVATREECIFASEIASNYKDINSVIHSLMLTLPKYQHRLFQKLHESTDTSKEHRRCICNSTLKEMTGLQVRCDLCEKPCSKSETVFHCEENEYHKFGYDLCVNCITNTAITKGDAIQKHKEMLPMIEKQWDEMWMQRKQRVSKRNKDNVSQPKQLPTDKSTVPMGTFNRRASQKCELSHCESFSALIEVLEQYQTFAVQK